MLVRTRGAGASIPTPALFSLLLLLVLVLLHSAVPVRADIHILAPSPGASLAADQVFSVRWRDTTNDGDPSSSASSWPGSIADLQHTYVLTLFSGANADPVEVYTLWMGDLRDVLANGEEEAGEDDGKEEGEAVVRVSVPGYVSGEEENAYFIGMTCTTSGGDFGTSQIYSSRFTLTGMTGTFSSAATSGLERARVGGDRRIPSAGPPPAISKLVARSPVDNPNGADPAAGAFGVSYNQQTGPTRYAPMQAVPGTKITATNTDPLYPSSSVQIVSEAYGLPTIETTVTQPQTAKFASHANTAAPASNPHDAMQRFLNRWKD